MSDGVHIDDFVLESLSEKQTEACSDTVSAPKGSLRLSDRLGEVEKELLRQVMTQCRNTREMATVLEISQPSVVRKLKEYNLGTVKMNK
jgi:transcriptional regulator with PAS, ATPase and Fis domain